MEFILNNLVLHLYENEEILKERIIKSLKINKDINFSYKIIKKAIDARKKYDILFVYSCLIEIDNYEIKNNPNIKKLDHSFEDIEFPRIKPNKRPIIVGFGPAGMFLGLSLARANAKPIILERGRKVEDRARDVELFKKNGIFSSLSNVCFGEGGAGTFSDGKLTTNINDPRIRFILKEFISHGAPKEIYYDAHPHIGSDYLQVVCKNIREEIISLGGEIHFESLFTNFIEENNQIKGIEYIEDGKKKYLETDDLILSLGHSSRDTFINLYRNNLHMEPKPFSLGVRIEMKQKEVNISQYGKEYNNPKLKAAEYKLVTHLPNGRSVYTFCMCPGGVVTPSNTEEDTIVSNGMSYFSRDLENANSALLVNVKVEDYYKNSPLDGMHFQEEVEKKAFSNKYPYFAPVQLLGDFLNDRCSTGFKSVKATYLPGTYFKKLDEILPPFISDSLKEAIPLLANKMKALGNSDNVFTGVETRSSSPISIPRDENYMSSIKGIYPCGEGAGYAGGITTAALDGIKVAESIIDKYLK